MNNNMLSIGTIVKLKDAEKLAMIVGFTMIDDSNTDNVVIYDYMGCAYPQGIQNYNYNLYFNATDIETVVFEGYSNDDDKKFKVAHEAIKKDIIETLNSNDKNISEESDL